MQRFRLHNRHIAAFTVEKNNSNKNNIDLATKLNKVCEIIDKQFLPIVANLYCCMMLISCVKLFFMQSI